MTYNIKGKGKSVDSGKTPISAIRRSARLFEEGVGPEFFEPQVNLKSSKQSPINVALPPEHEDVLE